MPSLRRVAVASFFPLMGTGRIVRGLAPPGTRHRTVRRATLRPALAEG